MAGIGTVVRKTTEQIVIDASADPKMMVLMRAGEEDAEAKDLVMLPSGKYVPVNIWTRGGKTRVLRDGPGGRTKESLESVLENRALYLAEVRPTRTSHAISPYTEMASDGQFFWGDWYAPGERPKGK
ncbi:MAG: hypothetical protein KJ709_02605 [Nanoarchaeota archaeon]|nr:hypothetical protein [Nanoarchaeota archaeon]